jgi:hypothetical protein
VLNRQLTLGIRSILLSVMLLLGGAGAVTASAEPVSNPPLTALAGFHLHKEASNWCLVARAGAGERPVEQTPCASFSDQDWTFDRVFKYGQWFNQIRNIDRGMCLVTRGDWETPAVVTTCNEAFDDQLWRATPYVGEVFQFKNVNSGLCLVARGASQATQTTCANFTDQFWYLAG